MSLPVSEDPGPRPSGVVKGTTTTEERDASPNAGAIHYPPPPRTPAEVPLPSIQAAIEAEAEKHSGGAVSIRGYEILGELGRGGMGVVYKARQVCLNRLIALKVIRAGSAALPEEIARFRIEAEAIARLHHPNILDIYEIGETADGPYLTLELVGGPSFAQRLAGSPFSPRQAAEVMLQLARAVHFAHQQGVIHRDLKPSNILLQMPAPGVSMQEESLDLKITDFGLAKLLGRETGQTQTGAVVGTPSYMAPEQARGAVKELGPATDVYSLGAILYEILTGRPPFRAATPLETLDLVRTQEPMPPSRLQPGTPRDLETVCLKCLHKDQARRYASAEALADDCEAFLKGEPIQARPVGTAERAWKWARRRPVVSALAAFSVVATVLFVGLLVIYQLRLERALHRSEDDRERMFAAVDTMLTEVGDRELAEVPEMEERRERLLKKALEIYQRLLGDKDDSNPTVRRKTAYAYWRIAWIHHRLERLEEAKAEAREALSLYERLAGEQPGDATGQRERANAFSTLAQICNDMGNLADAEEAARQAVALLESLPTDLAQNRLELAQACNYLALLYTKDRTTAAVTPFQPVANASDQARKLFERTLDLLQDRELTDPKEREALAEAYHKFGELKHRTQNLPQQAESLYQKAREVLEAMLDPSSQNGSAQGALAKVYHDLGVVRKEGDKPQEAESFFRKSLELKEQLAQRHPGVPAYGQDLALAHEALAGLYQSWADRSDPRAELALPGTNGLAALGAGLIHQARTIYLARAESHFHTAIQIRRPLVHKSPAAANSSIRLAEVYENLGIFYLQTNHPDKVEATYREAKAQMESLLRGNPEAVAFAVSLGKVMFCLGDFLRQHDKAEALDCLTRSITLLEGALQKDPHDSDIARLLVGSYTSRVLFHDQHNYLLEAVADLTRSIAIQEEFLKQINQQSALDPNTRIALVESYQSRAILLQAISLARTMQLVGQMSYPNPAHHFALLEIGSVAERIQKSVADLRRAQDLEQNPAASVSKPEGR
jgi:tetratricopeptide (TPR) repeat protein